MGYVMTVKLMVQSVDLMYFQTLWLLLASSPNLSLAIHSWKIINNSQKSPVDLDLFDQNHTVAWLARKPRVDCFVFNYFSGAHLPM